MSGAVGIISSDLSRYVVFSMSLSGLRTPVNTAIDYAPGTDRSIGRNKLVARMLDRGNEWLLFLDDDHAFSPDLLTKLLAHDVPVVGGLYLQRVAPFSPIAYGTKESDGAYTPLDLRAYTGDALVPVAGAGTGGMLIRSEVFHQMEPPWFQHTTEQSEDLFFCDRVREELGLPVYVDLAARLGHLAPSACWPTFNGGGWQVGFTFSESATLTIPFGYEPD